MGQNANVLTAKISRSQTVIVALITALGGFLTAYLTHSANGQKAHNCVQHWIKVESIQQVSHGLNGVEWTGGIRITIDVNGICYSFPTNTIWASSENGMVGERFPLPIGFDSYKIKLKAFAETSNVIAIYENRDFQEFQINQIPIKNASQRLIKTNAGSNEISRPCLVQYSIE